MIPSKLKRGDTIIVIAPSATMSIISDETRKIANEKFNELGINIEYGDHVDEKNMFGSNSIESRISDLHKAFSDPKINGVFTAIGGFNSHQLLRYIDWDLIKSNPKVFCGFSDITALNNAIYTKTGLVTYSGPHYSTFGQKLHFEYTLDCFKKCLMMETEFEIEASKEWSDDLWFINQDERDLVKNDGYLTINEGEASGTLIGANIGTLRLLQGTEYFPSLENSILFIEDDAESLPHHFDRDLQSLVHIEDFKNVKGIVIGRFQKESKMTNEILKEIIKTKKELANLPIIANVDFGHTDPKITFPVGGGVSIKVDEKDSSIRILRH